MNSAQSASALDYAGDGKLKSEFDLFDRFSVKAVCDEAESMASADSRIK